MRPSFTFLDSDVLATFTHTLQEKKKPTRISTQFRLFISHASFEYRSQLHRRRAVLDKWFDYIFMNVDATVQRNVSRRNCPSLIYLAARSDAGRIAHSRDRRVKRKERGEVASGNDLRPVFCARARARLSNFRKGNFKPGQFEGNFEEIN